MGNNIFEVLSRMTSNMPGTQKEALASSEKLRVNIAIAMVRLRKKLGITQKELAKRLGVSQAWVSRLENANNDHQLESIQKYLKALGADLAITVVHNKLNLYVSDKDIVIQTKPVSHVNYRYSNNFPSIKQGKYPIQAA